MPATHEIRPAYAQDCNACGTPVTETRPAVNPLGYCEFCLMEAAAEQVDASHVEDGDLVILNGVEVVAFNVRYGSVTSWDYVSDEDGHVRSVTFQRGQVVALGKGVPA